VFPPVRGGSQRLALLGSAFVVALAAAGCGRNDEPDLVRGKELYVDKCQRCHALARAGGGSDVGPDLDEAFGPARGDGLGEDTVAGVVQRQIALVRRNSIMPANLVEGEDARAVAAYVAAVAGQPGKDSGALAEAGVQVSTKPIVAEGGALEIPAADAGLAFVTSRAESKPGSVKFAMPNPQSTDHNIALKDEGGQVLQEGDVVGQGGTSTFTAKLTAGKFEFVCTVPGHEEGGMEGELTVK
jgi:mono/diheme cytochrome c family protein